MPPLIVAFSVLLGSIVGSFLNVVALRLYVKDFLQSRSVCPSCGTSLPSYDLIPLVSYLLLGGRCRFCHVPISLRYPLVELVGGAMFGILAAVASSPLSFVISATIFSLLLLIALYDLAHLIVPDTLVYPLIALSFTLTALTGVPSALLGGPILAAPFFVIALLSRGRAMGWGDVKLALGIGWFLGWESSLIAFLFSIWIGGIVGLVLILMRGPLLGRRLATITMRSEIPFAPFLVLGGFLAYVGGLSFFELLSLLTL